MLPAAAHSQLKSVIMKLAAWLGSFRSVELSCLMVACMRFPSSLIPFVVLAAVSAVPPRGVTDEPAAADPAVDFDRDIRPILASRCFHCHGPDQAQRQAGLRLDIREAVFEDRGGYAAVVPGEPGTSELWLRISAEDESLRMPPADATLSLSDDEAARIRQWIAEGARWEQHWSFIPPERPALPSVRHADRVQNGIDHFVFAQLEAAGLAPAAEADRRTLIRRATLDLTGLPPTPQEVEAFLADDSAQAWERVVDRLLNSPHYGERMAWDWLDAARYADTDGFQGDPTRSMWPWRDWLVDALNSNMPFDQLTTEMLAGDLLPDATAEQILATGFNRNHMYNGEGGRIAEETRVENVFDRTETTATVWLGLTMTCCRCHDHKFDPISQAEYYRLYAFFNNTSETGRGNTRGQAPPSRPYLTPERRAEVAALDEQLAELQRRLNADMPEVDAAQRDWEDALKPQIRAFLAQAEPAELSDWWQAGPVAGDSAVPDAAALQSFLAGDRASAQAASLSTSAERDAASRPAAPPPLASLDWEHRPDYADAAVQPLPDPVGVTWLTRTITAATPRSLELSLGSDDHITLWVNSADPVLHKEVARAAEPDQERVVVSLRAGINRLLMRIENTGGIAGFYFRRVSESVRGLSRELAETVVTPRAKRTPEAQQRLTEHYRSRHSDSWKALQQRFRSLQQQRERLINAAPTVMVMDSLPESQRRETRVLERGVYNKPTDLVVTAGTPSVLHALPDTADANRLDLARWIMSDDNPLTARVIANRCWQLFFGRALVTTPEDFGQTGRRPTHPQLLDWLAVEFRDTGWDVKQLHKTIVMSATYRQSSAVADAGVDPATARDVDPDNALHWHAPRYRRPSWMLRDQVLAVSGLLNREPGGPPVRPYQPEGVWAEATFGKIRYQPDSGADLYRRSLYVFWRRIVGPTMFFDSAKRQTCEVQPARTNSPLHALTTLNETAYVEAARGLAERILQSDRSNDRARLDRAFHLALARPASPEEARILLSRVQSLSAHYTTHEDAAVALLSTGQSDRDTTLSPAEHAAWTVVCSTILNLDEFLTRE